MACRVYEEGLRIEVGLAQAVPVDSGEQPPACYPYPALIPLPTTEVRELRTIVLENDPVRAVFAPDLGGRLLSFHDRGTGEFALQTVRLPAAEGGVRGCRWAGGLCVDAGWPGSPTEAAPVDALALSDEEGEVVGVRFFDLQAGSGLGVSTLIELKEGSATLGFEVRVHNREPRFVPYDLRIRHGVAGAMVWAGEGAWVAANAEHGLALLAAPGEFAGWQEGALCRLGACGWLPPHHQDAVGFSVMAVGGAGEVLVATPKVVVTRGDSGLRVRAPEALQGKLVLQGSAGTVEAPLDLAPGAAAAFGDPPAHDALAVMSSSREVLAGWPSQPSGERGATPETLPEVALGSLACRLHEGGDVGEPLQRLLPLPALRPGVLALGASSLLREGNPRRAAELLEIALGYSAEDPLLWWNKALAHRLAGDEGERPELPNAHFLSPLEPLLRAEATLGGGGPALVEEMAARPDDLVEAACRLIEAGAGSEALKWIEEAERHRNLPMLDYLAAFVLVRDTDLATEAAALVAKAGASAWSPPYPWRVVERAALRVLARAFPGDERIAHLLGRIERYSDSIPTSR